MSPYDAVHARRPRWAAQRPQMCPLSIPEDPLV